MTSVVVRAGRFDPATHGEIERAADELFRGHFGRLPWDETQQDPATAAGPATPLPERLFEAVIDGRVAGFARVFAVGEYLHLEQLSVHPDFARRGIGRTLVARVLEDATASGCSAVTLRTFADVPWNAPFYESSGFRRLKEAPTPFHEQLVRTEEGLGLLAHGERVHMIAPIAESTRSTRLAPRADEL